MYHSTNSFDMVIVCWCGRSSRPGISTDRHSSLFKTLKPLMALRSAHTVLPMCLVKQLKCLCKIFTKFAAKFHTHTHTHTLFFNFIVTLSLIWQTACAHDQFSGCSSTTNAHSEMGKIAVCCQNLTMSVLSSRSVLSVLVCTLFKQFSLFLNTTHRLLNFVWWYLMLMDPQYGTCFR